MLISEFSELSTGYSIYSKNLLKQLYNSNKYEVAELACYGRVGDPRLNNPPWKVYPTQPHPSDQEANRMYDADPHNAFGKGVCNSVFNDWKPDYVLTIFDHWYSKHILNLPNYYNSVPGGLFNLIWMPTVDAVNQKPEWLADYSQCEGLLCYTDWSRKVLEDEGRLFTHTEAPACGSEIFSPQNKARCKESFGISPETKIITMVSRNQRRKLFPDLIKTFGKFLEESGREDIVLWLHTSYPDNNGWDLPRILMDEGLCKKVILTYACECGNVMASPFCGSVAFCHNCNRWSAQPSNPGGRISDADMSRMMNATDLAVLHSNSEGQGIFPWQAAACAVPVCVTDYSALSSGGEKLGGYLVPPITLSEEIETGCMRAIPDNSVLKDVFTEFFSLPNSIQILEGAKTRENYIKNYSWDKTTKAWMDVIDSIPTKTWNKPASISDPSPYEEMNHVPHTVYTKWCITEVLRQPERLNTFFELSIVKELTEGVTGPDNKMIEISRKDIYDRLSWFRQELNNLERKRCG